MVNDADDDRSEVPAVALRGLIVLYAVDWVTVALLVAMLLVTMGSLAGLPNRVALVVSRVVGQAAVWSQVVAIAGGAMCLVDRKLLTPLRQLSVSISFAVGAFVALISCAAAGISDETTLLFYSICRFFAFFFLVLWIKEVAERRDESHVTQRFPRLFRSLMFATGLVAVRVLGSWYGWTEIALLAAIEVVSLFTILIFLGILRSFREMLYLDDEIA